MDKGRIGTEARERVLFIWEGAVATLPDRRAVRGLERLKGRLGLYDQAVGYWEIQERTISFMWTLFSRTFWRIDLVVTSRGAGFTQAVARKVLQNNWPIEYIYHGDATVLGRGLAHAPDVKRVYYGLDEHRWAFGPHGYHIDPDTPLGIHNA